MLSSDQEIRKIGQQNASYHVELKNSDQPSAPICWSDLGDVHRAKHRRTADAKAPDESEQHENRPVPGEGATECGNDVENGHHAKAVASSKFVAGDPGEHSAEDRKSV